MRCQSILVTQGSTYTFTHVTLGCLLGASEVCFTLDGGSLAPRVQAGKREVCNALVYISKRLLNLSHWARVPVSESFDQWVPPCLLYPIVSDVLRGPVKV